MRRVFMYRYDGDEIDDAELDGLLTEADCELTLDTDEGSDLGSPASDPFSDFTRR